jgi:hypothetical protein
MKHPALGAFPIADPAPVLEFLHDLDGKSGAHEGPADAMIPARADAHVDPVGLQADKRGRESRWDQRFPTGPRRTRECGDDCEKKREKGHEADWRPGEVSFQSIGVVHP